MFREFLKLRGSMEKTHGYTVAKDYISIRQGTGSSKGLYLQNNEGGPHLSHVRFDL